MSSQIKLDQVDLDGAIRETAGEMSETLAQDGDTRLDFLKKAGLAGGAVMGGGALLSALVPGAAFGRGSKLDAPPKSFGKGDIGILNYALTLEYLEAAFYNEAKKKVTLKDKDTKDFLAAVVRDENAHVKILKGILGKKAVASPKFDFGKTTSNEKLFVATSFALENTGVSAYSGQAFNIDDPAVLAGALSIVTIEARHAGLIGQILSGKKGIAPDGPTDKPVGAKDTLKVVAGTGFIKG
ncbi:MAG: ferritin-like domain-containing protein [Solirubrobacterales bacterium]